MRCPSVGSLGLAVAIEIEDEKADDDGDENEVARLEGHRKECRG